MNNQTKEQLKAEQNNNMEEKFSNDISQDLLTSIENWLATTATQTHNFLEQKTHEVGKNLKSVTDNDLLQSMNETFGAEWLMSVLGEVDIAKTQAHLQKLQLKYPDHQLEELAQQVIIEKSWEAARVGLVTNVIPPVAATMAGLELATTAKLQAEMIYEIAGAYGLDLKEPARRGEVFAIFGLSLGTGILKSGLILIETIPGIGAVIGASSNAAVMYGLGYTACRFYEGKYQSFTIQNDQ